MNQQTNEHIDLVVTYVDGNEPVWRSNLSQFNNNYNKLRFRNWNLMRFWFRGIEKNMPFIHNIYFVVSNIEQVPNWINRRHVNVVLHADIIPKQLLPTFTSTTIEMFLHKIPNLSEKFIYSNDDTFANNSILPEYFFTEQGLTRHTLKKKDSANKKIFWMQCKNSWKLAQSLADMTDNSKEYFYIGHSMTPMLKSVFEEVHQKAYGKILEKCTKFREPWNFNQYLFPDYALLTRRAENASEDELTLKYVLVSDKINKLSNAILVD